MAEPLIAGQGFLVERHPGDDVLELVGAAPGPAGAVELPLGDATLSLDAAEPDLVVGLTAALDGSRGLTPWATAVVDALVGPEVRAGAQALPADGRPRRVDGGGPADGRPRPVDGGGPGGGRPRRVDVGGPGGGVDRELVVLALVADAGAAPGLLPEERAVAALEVAALARRLDLARWIDPGGGAARAAAELLAADPGGVGRHPQLAGHTSALLDEYALVAGDAALADRLRSVAAELRGDLFTVADVEEMPAAFGLATAGAAMPAAAAPMAAERAVARARQATRAALTVATDALPLLLAGEVPRVSPTTGDEFEVRLRGWSRRAPGWWVCISSPADRVPLAVVPVHAEGDDAVARFIAPVVWGDVVVGIVDDPAEPLPSPHAAAFRAAVATGKRAARHGRLGHVPQAAAAWRESARLHRAAGDDWRSAVADAFATGGPRGRRTPPANPPPGRGATSIGLVVTDLLGPEP